MNANQNPQQNQNQLPTMPPEFQRVLDQYHSVSQTPEGQHVQRDLISREQAERDRGIRVQSRVAPAIGNLAAVDTTPQALSPQEQEKQIVDSVRGAILFGRYAIEAMPQRRSQLQSEIQALDSKDPRRADLQSQLAAMTPKTLFKGETRHRKWVASVLEDETNHEGVARGWTVMSEKDPLNKHNVKEYMLTTTGHVLVYNRRVGDKTPPGAIDAHYIENIAALSGNGPHGYNTLQHAALRLPGEMVQFAHKHQLELTQPTQPLPPAPPAPRL